MYTIQVGSSSFFLSSKISSRAIQAKSANLQFRFPTVKSQRFIGETTNLHPRILTAVEFRQLSTVRNSWLDIVHRRCCERVFELDWKAQFRGNVSYEGANLNSAGSHPVLLIKSLPIIWQLVVRCYHGIGDHSNSFHLAPLFLARSSSAKVTAQRWEDLNGETFRPELGHAESPKIKRARPLPLAALIAPLISDFDVLRPQGWAIPMDNSVVPRKNAASPIFSLSRHSSFLLDNCPPVMDSFVNKFFQR